jgi:hypothetical protein
MSVTEREGIGIEVSIGEFVDRHLINRVRTEKRSSVESHWLVARVEESSSTVEQLNVQPAIIEHLYHIHLGLWDLEQRVRMARDDAEFCGLARIIFALNDERHNLKAQIDQAHPTRCSVRRTYSTGDS